MGATYHIERIDSHFGCYYFLSEDRMIHEMVQYGLKNILAVVGSQGILFFSFLRFIMKEYNRMQLEAKFIRACYFDVNEIRLPQAKFQEFPAKPLKFSMQDKLAPLLRVLFDSIFICSCCKFKSSKLYLNGISKIKHDLNLFKIIQTIHKMKACLQYIINDDLDALEGIQQIYFRHTNIHERGDLINAKDITKQFLDRDDKKLTYKKSTISKEDNPNLIRKRGMRLSEHRR